ncbi:MAG: hypothetical protein DI537_57905 [Stutzerimonas stutzeri]|nr:MAG: hypothetical protein DI537_57905 [Stutzerimonas stutzeri]
MDIGRDNGEPVVDDYGPCRGAFTGAIESVTINISGEAHNDHDLLLKARHAKQWRSAQRCR